jgi:hypothetical protein
MEMGTPCLRVVATASLVLVGACGNQWRRIEPTGAGFAIEMPSNVDCGRREWKYRTASATWVGRTCEARAEPLVSFLPASSDPNIHYSVSWVVVPAELRGAPLEEVLAAAAAPEIESRSPLIAEAQRFWSTEGEERYGSEWRSTPALLGGEPALHRDAAPTGTVRVEGFVGRSRVALRRGKLYTVYISGQGGALLEKTWSRMVESFAFTEEPRS